MQYLPEQWEIKTSLHVPKPSIMGGLSPLRATLAFFVIFLVDIHVLDPRPPRRRFPVGPKGVAAATMSKKQQSWPSTTPQ
jgi:hypothetical protein